MKPKKLMVKILILLIAELVLNLSVFPYVYANGAGSGYGNNSNGNTGGIQEIEINTEKTVEMYIVEGSGYYLGAVVSINNILQLYEGQNLYGIDLYRFNRLLDQALINMDKAITTYDTLIRQAEITPYNKEVLGKLAGFDYNTFMIEKFLNKEIFQQVEGYLKAGYITGVFKHTYENLLNIRVLMISIKSLASVNKLPDIETIWKLNESCLYTSYFGSYVARVFNNLK